MKSFSTSLTKSVCFFLFFTLFNFSSKSQVGSVLDFDGVDDYVNLGTTALKPTAGITAEAWINMSVWGGNPTFLGNTQASGYALYIQAGDLRGIVRRNGTYAIVSVPVASITAGWHHLALTYDGRYTKLYLDAVLMSTDDAGAIFPITYIANSTLLGAESFTAGALLPEPGLYFQGQMDEVRIWNYARSQCDIYTYKGCEIATSAPGLLGNYHFNQGISGGLNTLSIILNDASGNANHGTLSNFLLNFGSSNWLSPGPFSNGFVTPAPTPTITTGQEYSLTIGLPNGQTNVSDWTPWVTTFTNPLPGGAVVTGMNLSLDGVDQGWGGTGHVAQFFAGGEHIAGFAFQHSIISFSTASTKPFPYYNYGGVNTFSFYFAGWPGWQGFISNVSLTIRYQLINSTPVVVCQNSTTVLNGFGANSYTWSGGITNGVPFVVTSSQNYTVTGEIFGCASSNTVQVNAIPAPTITSITGGTFLCTGSALTLSMQTSGAVSTYSWSTGAATSSAVVSPVVTTTYTATATNTSGCSHTATNLVTVGSLPTISVNSGSICSGNSFTIVPSGAVSYTYSGGSNVVAPLVSFSYLVSGTDAQGCVSAAPAISDVTVRATPTVAVNSGTVCYGQSFTIAPTGALSFTYVTGSTIVTPSVSTSYSIIGASAFGCPSSNTAISSVVVNTLPIVSISTPTAATCNGGSVTLTANGADTYTWSSGISNGVAFVPAASSTYSVNGTNTLTGCTGTNNAAITVTVYALPLISLPNYTLCTGNSITLVPSGAATYTYSGGSPTVNPLITTSYSVIGTSTAGCVSAFPAVSTVSVFITPTLSVNSGSICAGQTFTISPSGANSYTISGGSFVVNPLSTSNYTLSGTSADGCVAANPVVSSLTVHALPVVAISTSSNALCSGGSVTLTASNAASYTWSPGAQNATVLSVSPVSNTSYTLAGTSTAGCSSTNAPVQAITVYSLPVLSTGTPSTAICFGTNASPSVTGAFTYTWQPGNLTGSSILVSPASSTNYTVIGSSAFGCLSTNTLVSSVVVNSLPVLSLSASQPAICFGASTTLTPGGADVYTLNPGAVTGTSFTVSPATTTPYTLAGTNTLTGCSSSSVALLTVTVNPLPVVSISSSTNALCFGQSANLVAANAATYTWQPGAFVGQIFTVTPNATTTYTLFGTNALGCTNTNLAVQSITVHPLPVVSTNASPAVICVGNSLTLTGSGANTYTWSGGVLNGVAFAPMSGGTYTVNGTNTLTGCSSTNSAVQSITVNPLPNITINSATTAVCSGFSTSLSGAGAVTYTWSGGITNAVPFQPVSTQQYTVTGTSALGCTNIAIQDVTVYPLPVVSANASQTVLCFGESLTLSGSGADTYTWTPAISNAISFTPAVSATYSVVGTNTLTGCTSTNTASQFIQVNNLPVVSASVSNALICAGFTTMLSGIGANSYTWTGGVINASAFSPSSTASYTVTGTDLNGCNNNAVGSVSVNPLPVLTVSSANPLTCSGETTTLSASGAITYTWNTGANTASLLITLNTSTSFTLSGTDGNNCQNAVVYVQQVDPCAGVVEIVPEIKNVTCNNRKDGEIELTSNISYSQNKVYYFWSSPELCADSSCNSLKKLSSGSYAVRVRVEYTLSPTYAKVDTLDLTLTVEDNNPPCPLTVYNGLTLNGDGINDVFYIENIHSYKNNKVSFFNRWGVKMAEITGYNNDDKVWPLDKEIDKLISGTYFYIIDKGDDTELEKGWLEVIKN
ncbi:MAG: gliding motility-associated C-terminal domain-containing protein [Bacteroidia bacterium]|nr:gliding motility-associated C-terminal domain-containing protein [Bacteroidia bacterium]